MKAIIKLRKVQDGGIIGYKRLDVLAIYPWALSRTMGASEMARGEGGLSPTWAMGGVQCKALCVTERGLMALSMEDIENDIDNGCYAVKGGKRGK